MIFDKRLAAIAAFVAFSFTSFAAIADDHPFKEGQVVQVSAIRTEYGKFDEYMKFLDTTWKATQEASIKAGYSTGYRVVAVEARAYEVFAVIGGVMKKKKVHCPDEHEVELK